MLEEEARTSGLYQQALAFYEAVCQALGEANRAAPVTVRAILEELGALSLGLRERGNKQLASDLKQAVNIIFRLFRVPEIRILSEASVVATTLSWL